MPASGFHLAYLDDRSNSLVKADICLYKKNPNKEIPFSARSPTHFYPVVSLCRNFLSGFFFFQFVFVELKGKYLFLAKNFNSVILEVWFPQLPWVCQWEMSVHSRQWKKGFHTNIFLSLLDFCLALLAVLYVWIRTKCPSLCALPFHMDFLLLTLAVHLSSSFDPKSHSRFSFITSQF